MPNHVTTTLRMTGPVQTIAAVSRDHLVVHPEKQDTLFDGTPMVDRETGQPVMVPSHVQFDFETLIPMPACLKGIPASSTVSEAIEVITGQSMASLVLEKNPDDVHAAQMQLIHESFADLRTPERVALREAALDRLKVEELELGRKALAAIEECGYPTWYEWALAHWGTKWNAYDCELVESEATSLVVRFQTAWSTPVKVLEELARRYPDIEFTTDSYDEGGNFAAHGEGHDGEFVEDTFGATPEAYEKAYGVAREDEEDEEENEVQHKEE